MHACMHACMHTHTHTHTHTQTKIVISLLSPYTGIWLFVSQIYAIWFLKTISVLISSFQKQGSACSESVKLYPCRNMSFEYSADPDQLASSAGLDLHCLQRQGMSRFSRTRVKTIQWNNSPKLESNLCFSVFFFLRSHPYPIKKASVPSMRVLFEHFSGDK